MAVTIQASEAWSVFLLPGAGFDIGSRGGDRYQPTIRTISATTSGRGSVTR